MFLGGGAVLAAVRKKKGWRLLDLVGQPRLETTYPFLQIKSWALDQIWRSGSGADVGGFGPLIHDRRTAIAYHFMFSGDLILAV